MYILSLNILVTEQKKTTGY